MAIVKMSASFEDKGALSIFFDERLRIQNEFNQKVDELKREMEEILKENKEKVLYSITFPSDTYVQLSVDAMNNFYHQFKHLHSVENGILLKEIQIVLKEYSSNFKLASHGAIKFVFSMDDFNSRWASFPFEDLYFDDEDFELSDKSMGACLDPKFIDPEKYFLVKEHIIEIQNIFKEIQEEKLKKS